MMDFDSEGNFLTSRGDEHFARLLELYRPALNLRFTQEGRLLSMGDYQKP